ncbi:nucleus protein [Mycena rosella]|uniref:Nucleus protein n=1 Tax=Mycena rosella TaxID=1033263 RepID=A0AAD7DQ83_MYCRO|nr:nucleus protein [Mycena rosella]
MPRGIPNARRDEDGLRYTTFHVPLAPNPKHTLSNYLKSESQSIWARNAQKKSKARQDDVVPPQDSRRGSQIIVIHPGSRFLRIGKGSDVFPVSVPNVVARKINPASDAPLSKFVEAIYRPRKGKTVIPQEGGSAETNDEYEVTVTSDDPFDEKIAEVTISLRDRMRFYKLRVTPNAANVASTFNEQFQPEIIAEHNDAYQLEWVKDGADVLALRLANPQESGYAVRWPIRGSNFNTRDYGSSAQVILADVETVIQHTLRDRLGVNPGDYKDYSVVLVVPDLYDRSYLREFANLLLVTMGFKQLCAQQESLAATYGAGLSNACVVDIGAVKTSIACVDEGLIIPDTRLNLNMGGDDITEFLYVLLERIHFPYRDINLARSYDWGVMEDLKARLCTLAEGDVALNLYDFIVRQPFKPTEKYGLRAYDEIILAPMVIFEPRMVQFKQKQENLRSISHPDVSDEILEHHGDQITSAMIISTQHLMPAIPMIKPPAARGDADTIEIVQLDEEGKGVKTLVPTKHPGGFGIDVCFEASKLPLDVAIFNSARAAGGDEKIRKYLQAVLVIGGSANIPGMAHGLESRLQAIATPLVADMEKVQIIPPPKEVEPTVLAWKGAAVLGKMDGVSDLWVTQADWDLLGLRGLKERCFFL